MFSFKELFKTKRQEDSEYLKAYADEIDDTLDDLDNTAIKIKDKIRRNRIQRKTGLFMAPHEGEKA